MRNGTDAKSSNNLWDEVRTFWALCLGGADQSLSV